MQRVYDPSNIIEASIVKGLLEQCDIEVYLSGFYLQGGIGEIPVSGYSSLWVSEQDAETALDLIKQYEDGQR